ncbi:MAG: glycosyltransferase family 2 protein [Phycisphaerae bacterium]|nr:glycosyltransferase family 2 protein [Phycisphaerae bacterium]
MNFDATTVLAALGAVFALQALVLGAVNLKRYARSLAPTSAAGLEKVSVCIPARNEESNIEACVRSVLQSTSADVEVVCYDDQSTDRTPEILAGLRREDARVRVAPTVALPDGWNGKQHGCWRMAQHATGGWFLFTDADVRFEPTCIARTLAEARRRDVALLSTVPRQITGTFGEALVIPLIHFILLSYLPIGRMRRTLDPSASAGCGQFLFARADAYHTSGGHAEFRDSMHDGIKMPRAFRSHRFRTDLFDGTDLVACRMYRGFVQTWNGFAKNAFEGLGSIALLVLVTVLHLVGHVFPWIFLIWTIASGRPFDIATGCALVAIAASTAERVLFAIRFRQSLASAFLHPIGICVMTALQWYSLYLAKTGRRAWKGRGGSTAPSPEPSTF